MVTKIRGTLMVYRKQLLPRIETPNFNTPTTCYGTHPQSLDAIFSETPLALTPSQVRIPDNTTRNYLTDFLVDDPFNFAELTAEGKERVLTTQLLATAKTYGDLTTFGLELNKAGNVVTVTLSPKRKQDYETFYKNDMERLRQSVRD